MYYKKNENKVSINNPKSIITKRVSQLTSYEIKKLNYHNRSCSICGERFYDNETITFTKTRSGKFVFYEFFHNYCFKHYGGDLIVEG